MHPMLRARIILGSTIALSLLAVTPFASAASPPDTVSSTIGKLKVERLTGLEFPWGMALLPDGKLLVTEKPGRLRLWHNGKLSEPLGGVPNVVYRGPRDQGGLLDVEADPNFAQNKLVYLSFVEAAAQQPTDQGETDDFRFRGLDLNDNIVRGGAVARGRLEGDQLQDVQVIWRQVPKTLGRGHFGHRLVFSKDGKLFITSGDRMRFAPAQSLESNLGKVIRLNPDGSIPKDNPFVGKEGARGEIWSYGHRNVIAAAIDPASDRLWVVEMGPLGGDELNLVERGLNYGWPLVSDGDHYQRPEVPTSVTAISGHGTSKEFEPPIRSWTPVISPSGAAFYTGNLFPQWRGSVLIGGLSSQAIIRLVLDDKKVALEERIDMKSRIRDVLPAPDGTILLLVDAKDGGLFRLSPPAGQPQSQ